MPPEVKDIFVELDRYRIFFVIFAIFIGMIVTLMCNFPKDNIIEQIAEEVIKHETGIEIDFSSKIGEK